jgi:hypothetical protein
LLIIEKSNEKLLARIYNIRYFKVDRSLRVL